MRALVLLSALLSALASPARGHPISDQEGRNASSKRAREFAQLNYDWPSIADKVEIAY
jgi:hypothetical protein